MIKELVAVAEFRHIFGCVFNDNGPIGIEKELEIFKKVEDSLRV